MSGKRFCQNTSFLRLMMGGFLTCLTGCASQNDTAQPADSVAGAQASPASHENPGDKTPPRSPVQFTDITEQSGIKFKHTSGAFGIALQPETMGSGVAFLDYDSDGYQDIFFVNSRYWTDAELEQWKQGDWTKREAEDFDRNHPPGTPHMRTVPKDRERGRVTGALYHNNRDGTFTDVTTGCGLDVEMYGMGAAVGDYDNDGRPDLYLTAYGHNFLFRNESVNGKPTFRDVTGRMGVRDKDWSSSAMWIDYDKDGRLDLFVCHFLDWTPRNDIYGSADRIHKGIVRPAVYDGLPSRLYRNLGSRFEDVSRKAGIDKLSKGLAIASCDYDSDGWPDIVVANDGAPDYLFHNNKNGTFSEVGSQMGIAYDKTGMARAGMGLDTADIDHSNRDSIVVSNFAGERLGLYHNRSKEFIDVAPETTIGAASDKYLSWGVAFLDIENDGWPDIFVANGHVNDHFNIGGEGITQAQRPLLFLNDRRVGNFPEIGRSAGAAMQVPMIARGLACGDIDLDGDVDVVLTSNNGPARLLRNDGSHTNHALRLILQGTKSNTSGIGTLVKVKLSENDGLRRWVRSGSSYLSQSELPVTLGLGQLQTVPRISLYWPSGKVTQLNNIDANQILTINEDNGIVKKQLLDEK